MKSEEPPTGRKFVPLMSAGPGLDWSSGIGNHLPDDEFHKLRNWHFKQRVERIGEWLEAEGFSSEELASFRRFVEDLDPVRELRNHLAHGYFLVCFDPETKESSLSLAPSKDIGLEDAPDARHLTFDELLAGMQKLPQLIEAMQIFIEEAAARAPLS